MYTQKQINKKKISNLQHLFIHFKIFKINFQNKLFTHLIKTFIIYF